jgi:hypothetical protein
VTDFRIASDEWQRWWDAQPAHVVRGVETDSARQREKRRRGWQW